MTKREAKRSLLRDLATILGKDQDLIPHDLPDPSRERSAFEAAYAELVAEFERRGAE